MTLKRIVTPVHLQPGLDGYIDEVVLRLSEGIADFFGDTDHLELLPIDGEDLAQRIGIGEELVGHIGADHANHVAMLVVAVGDVAAGRDLFHVHVANVGGHAADIDVLQVLPLGAEVCRAPHFHANRLWKLQIVAQGLVVFPGDVAIAPGRLEQFLGIADDGKLVDQKDVRSQVGDAAGEIAVHPADESDHQNERGDRQNNAQQHEKRAQLVRAHGLQRDQRRLAQEAAVAKRALRNGRIHAPNR